MKRILIIAIILLFYSSPAQSASSYHGWCEQGNATPLPSPPNTIKVQQSFPVCTLTIYVDNSPGAAITSITRSSNTVTVNVGPGQGFLAGQGVTIANVTNSSFNGSFTILTTNTITVVTQSTVASQRVQREPVP